MLVQFTFENYKSFRHETNLSMVASNYFKENTEDLVEFDKYSLLRSAAIFGANASGKSKLFAAFNFMREYVLSSTLPRVNNLSTVVTDPFRLNTQTQHAPSMFEAIFIIDNVQYRYGFEVTQKEVVSEWLFRKVAKETLLFDREYQQIDYSQSDMKKIKNLIKEDMIRPEALLLSVLDQFNDELASKISDWFESLWFVLSSEDRYILDTLNNMEGKMKDKILKLMHEADFNLDDIIIKGNNSKMFDSFREYIPYNKTAYKDIRTLHAVYDEDFIRVGDAKFSFVEDESNGTIKFFGLAAPIINTLERGSILFVDEFDAGLHPELISAIIKLFQSKESNPKNAQLIFNTHDTGLLNSKLFRRDQFYIVDKNRYGESSLSSVAEFKVKSDSNMEKRYLEGRFGALPYLKQFGDNLKKEMPHENEK